VRNYLVGLRNRAHRTVYVTVRAMDSTDAILRAENAVEGTDWTPIYAGVK